MDKPYNYSVSWTQPYPGWPDSALLRLAKEIRTDLELMEMYLLEVYLEKNDCTQAREMLDRIFNKQ
jgi:hypothetical protein